MKIGVGGFGTVYKALLPGGQGMADYQMPLFREIDGCLKAECDKLADAFEIDDIDISSANQSSSARLPERVKLIIEEIEREKAALREDLYSANRKFAEYYNFPEYIGNLSRNLEYLNLDHNHIFGSIPPGIVNLVGLQSLNMQLNQFTGTIPSEICIVNVTVGEGEERMMTTRLHAIADVFCIGCGSILGWKYETANEKSQKYKEGKSILERFSILAAVAAAMEVKLEPPPEAITSPCQ
ncbi:hypothetical protein ACSBR1_025647 [Camellia fascicularis]